MNGPDLFHRIEVGREIRRKSMLGTDFNAYPDHIAGELRACLLPLSWYVAPTAAEGKTMVRTEAGWLYTTSRSQLAEDIAATIEQLDTGQGSVREIRVETLQRLVTAEEWEDAEAVVRANRRFQ